MHRSNHETWVPPGDHPSEALSRPLHPKRRRILKSIAASTLTAVLAGGGYAYYHLVPEAKINANAAFVNDDIDEQMSTVAAVATLSHMSVSCDNDTLEQHGGLVNAVEGKEYNTNGRVYPLPLLIGQVAMPVTILREEVCTDILNTNNLQPEVDESGSSRTTYYEGPKLFARAVAILLHEKEHTVQIFDEAEANCYAFQKLPDALIRLGMNPEIVPLVSKAVTTSSIGTQPPEYYSPECRAGGKYDLQVSDNYLTPSQ